MDLQVWRGSATVPKPVDRTVDMAAVEAIGEGGADTTAARGGTTELMPDEGFVWGCGGCQREHQSPAAARQEISQPALPPAQGAADDGFQDRIRGHAESGPICRFLHVLVQSRLHFQEEASRAASF